MRTTTEIIQDHLSKRLAGKTDEDIQANYSPDIIILSSYGVFRGYDGVRQSAAKLQRDIGNATFHYKHTIIEKQFALLEWTATSKEATVNDGADSFVIKNDKITMQTVHYTAYPNPKITALRSRI